MGAALVRTDLHTHSSWSDGRVRPEELVAARARQRFDVVALTDHDTFAGVAAAARVARAHGITLVPAMEATSFLHFGTERAEQLHVLAYFPPAFLDDGRLGRTQLAARAERIHEAWRAYVLDFVARQAPAIRAALDEDELLALPMERFPQLQSFILRIAARCPGEYKSFQLDHVHFWEDRALFGWSPEELMDVIRADGGFDVVAHPIRYRDRARLREVLAYASGIEVYTSRHTAEVSARFLAMARELGKHWTASTDDHQHRPFVGPTSGTPRDTMDRILRGA